MHSKLPSVEQENSLSRKQQCWILNTINHSIKCLFKGFLTGHLTGQLSIHLRNLRRGEKWLTWIAVWLEGSLLTLFSAAPAITEQGFLCARTTPCMQPGTATVPAQGLGEGARACSWQAFCGVKRFCTVTGFTRGDISSAWKTLSISVQKNSSIHVFVAITAIHFCADFKLDIWISQLLCAHAKEIPYHLEYTREPTPSSLAFHLIRAHFCCNLGFEVQVQFSWTSLKLLKGGQIQCSPLHREKARLTAVGVVSSKWNERGWLKLAFLKLLQLPGTTLLQRKGSVCQRL